MVAICTRPPQNCWEMKTMTYNSLIIANYFLYLANRDNKLVSAMKLQKLVYFAHGWYLALTGDALIDEQVEAWSYGPVIPSIYHRFKHFGSNPIEGFASDIFHPEAMFPEDQEIKRFLEKIWQVYGKLTAIQLSNMTHEPDTPWYKTRGERAVPKSTDINPDIIKEYFKEELEKVSA